MLDPQQPDQPQIPRVEEVGTLPRGALIVAGGAVFVALGVAGVALLGVPMKVSTPPTAPPAMVALPVPTIVRERSKEVEPPLVEAPAPEVPTDEKTTPEATGKPRLGAHFTGTANVRAGTPTVSGRLAVDVVKKTVRERHGRFRMCYEQALGSDATLRGRLSLRFVIGRGGAVSNVSVMDSTLGEKLDRCVSSAAFSMTFPQPEGGIVTVVYPVMFETTPR